MKPRKSINRASPRGALLIEVDSLHFKYLKLIRQNTCKCEICGRMPVNIGRFHILRVGRYPRLRYYDLNGLLAGWECCHYPWHHYGPNDPRNLKTLEKIIYMRGESYMDILLLADKTQDKHNMVYLRILKEFFKKEIKVLK